MVYCGKPSKGCSHCRERKTRCDLKEPSCGQCLRSKKQCPGYRNQLDLMFRDESKSVPKKVKAKARKTQAEHKEATVATEANKTITAPKSGPINAGQPNVLREISTPSVENVLVSQTQMTIQDQESEEDACEYFLNEIQQCREQRSFQGNFIKSLVPMAEDLATGFFYINHVYRGDRTNGHFGFVPALYAEQSCAQHLKSSMIAVGLAGFANTVRSPELSTKARASYVTALRLINQGLRDPNSATKDSLLLSIMMLSIYETVAGNSQKSLKAWTEHINGAATLIKLRGVAQFRTKAGVRLFLQMFSNIMVSCVQRSVAMPAHILALRCEVARFIDTSEPAWCVSEAILRFIAFRSDVRIGLFPTPESKLEAALAIDESFAQVSSELPASWQYEVVYTTEHTDEVWNGCYHVYGDYWVAQMWNALRVCRILVNEYVRDALLCNFLATPPRWMDREHTDMFQKASDIECQMRDEILASVPQHTGFVDAHRQKNPDFGASSSNPPSAGEMSSEGTSSVTVNHDTHNQPAVTSTLPKASIIELKETSPLRSAGGYFLLWPLYVAGEMNLGTEEISAWVIRRLRCIGDNMGIMQAHGLADVLVKKEDIRVWDVNDNHIRHEAVERVQRKAKTARRQRYAEVYGSDISEVFPEGPAWEVGPAMDDFLEGGGFSSIPLNDLCPIEDTVLMQEREFESLTPSSSSLAFQDLCPINDTTLMQEREFESLMLSHIDEQHLIDQVGESEQTKLQTLRPDIESLMDENFGPQGTELLDNFDISMQGSNRIAVFEPSLPIWEQQV